MGTARVRIWDSYLADSSSIISRKASCDSVGGGRNVRQALPVNVLGFGSESRKSQDLSILHDALLELAKQDAKP